MLINRAMGSADVRKFAGHQSGDQRRNCYHRWFHVLFFHLSSMLINSCSLCLDLILFNTETSPKIKKTKPLPLLSSIWLSYWSVCSTWMLDIFFCVFVLETYNSGFLLVYGAGGRSDVWELAGRESGDQRRRYVDRGRLNRILFHTLAFQNFASSLVLTSEAIGIELLGTNLSVERKDVDIKTDWNSIIWREGLLQSYCCFFMICKRIHFSNLTLGS